MSDTFAKLASKIISSTVWQLDDHTRLVWVTMLAMKDKDHIVTASVPGLAHFARVPVESCRRALEILSSPDKDSQTEDENEGRRIQPVENGWFIINGEKYRWFGAKAEMQEAVRLRVAAHRAKLKALHAVTCNKTLRCNDQAEAEAEAEERKKKEGASAPARSQKGFVAPTDEEAAAYATEIALPKAKLDTFLNHYKANGWKVGRNAMKDWKATMRNWLNDRFASAAKPTNDRNAHTYAAGHEAELGKQVAEIVRRRQEENNKRWAAQAKAREQQANAKRDDTQS